MKDTAKIPFLSLNKTELQELIKSLGQPKFRAKQIWQWVYKHGAISFDSMDNLPKDLRFQLNERFSLARPLPSSDLISEDGTRKWLLRFSDCNEAEAVFIPEKERGTLCVSSQVGCTLTCTFCHTGTQKLVRNISVDEIVGQLMLAKDLVGDWNTKDESQRIISNVVMMGMGEPLLNYDNVVKAIQIYLDEDGLNMSKRKITLSTSGLVPQINDCGKELGVNLAISLHAVNDKLRDEIVPINRKYPIKELLQSCKEYPTNSLHRRITFEYVMLDNVNDSDEDAHELVNLIKDIPAKVNLIPFNPWPGSPYNCSSKERIKSFATIVEKAGYQSPVRTPRGQDIFAACGQLKSESVKVRKSLS